MIDLQEKNLKEKIFLDILIFGRAILLSHQHTTYNGQSRTEKDYTEKKPIC